MSRARDVADVQDNVGGAVAPYVAGKNAIINGDFGVAQRGTSINTATITQAYTLDRLWVYSNGPAVTTSQQATSDTTNLPFIQYCARLQRQSGQTSTSPAVWNMPLETKTSMRFVGQTVTLSFYARKSSSYTGQFGAYIYSGTGIDQSGLGGYTGQATVASTGSSLTTTWTRYSATGTVATSATELRLEFNTGVYSGTAGASDYFEITGVQLEAGSTATPFTTATGTIQGELAACQRYYFRATAETSAFAHFSLGFASSTTSAQQDLKLPVTMRTEPTSVDFSTLRLEDINSAQTVTTCTLSTNSSTTNTATFDVGVASGLTAYRPYFLGANNSTSAYVGVSAEL
jgi:hypothetical protein